MLQRQISWPSGVFPQMINIWVDVNNEAETKIYVFGVLIKLFKRNFVRRWIISNQMPKWLDIKETKLQFWGKSPLLR